MYALTLDERAGALAVFDECLFWRRVEERNKRPTLKQIVIEVAEKHGITPEHIMGRSHRPYIVLARHEVMYRARRETQLSLPDIGRRLGGRDHTTVIHGIRQHVRRMAVKAREEAEE